MNLSSSFFSRKHLDMWSIKTVIVYAIGNHVLLSIKLFILFESTTRNLKNSITGLLEVSKVSSNDGSDTTWYKGRRLKGIDEVILSLEDILKVLGFVVPVFGNSRWLSSHLSKSIKTSSEVVVFSGPSLNFFLVVSDIVFEDRSGNTIAEGNAAWATEDRGDTATINFGSFLVSPVFEFLRFTSGGLSEFTSTIFKVFVHLDHTHSSFVHLQLDGFGVSKTRYDGVVKKWEGTFVHLEMLTSEHFFTRSEGKTSNKLNILGVLLELNSKGLDGFDSHVNTPELFVEFNHQLLGISRSVLVEFVLVVLKILEFALEIWGVELVITNKLSPELSGLGQAVNGISNFLWVRSFVVSSSVS